MRHEVAGAAQAPVATTLRIRTRLRPSLRDTLVLAALGEHFSRLRGRDLALRCKYGPGHDKEAWVKRKQALTSMGPSTSVDTRAVPSGPRTDRLRERAL